MSRQEMIDVIEGDVGIYQAIWNEWPAKQLEILYKYVLLHKEYRMEMREPTL